MEAPVPKPPSAKSVDSQAYLNKVARQLNERPRETLQFETPAERFNACVASIGGAGSRTRTSGQRGCGRANATPA